MQGESIGKHYKQLISNEWIKKKSDLSDSEQPESMRWNLFDKQNFNYDDYHSDIETE